MFPVQLSFITAGLPDPPLNVGFLVSNFMKRFAFAHPSFDGYGYLFSAFIDQPASRRSRTQSQRRNDQVTLIFRPRLGVKTGKLRTHGADADAESIGDLLRPKVVQQ